MSGAAPAPHPVPTLPGRRVPLLAVALVVAAAAAWRFAAPPIAGTLSIAALVAAWSLGARMAGDRRWLEHLLAPALLIAAVLLLARHEPALWPCELCAGGKAYERLGPLPTVGWAFAAVLALQIALGGCHWWCQPRGGDAVASTPGWIQAIAWALIGTSLFWLWTSWRLELACAQCLAFHTAVIALIGPLRAGSLRALPRLGAAAAGFLALLAAYGPALRIDLEAERPVPPPVEDAERAWSQRADAGRSWGAADAPLALELGLDFQCPHCAEGVDAILATLRPALADGRARLTVRHVVRASEPASGALARWAFAAAERGEHQRFVRAMLGSRAGASAADLLRAPAADVVALPELAAAAETHAAATARLVEDDKSRLRALGFAGRTPFLARLGPDGRVLQRWSVRIDAAELAAALASGRPPASATHAPTAPSTPEPAP